MPAAQLLTTTIEVAINRLLALDDNSQSRLQKLTGKSLKVELKELPWPLTFVFAEPIQVLADTESEADCSISLALDTLKEMQDSSRITQLIQQQKLKVMGDIYVAQSFSSLISELDIDWEEQLSQYTGDVIAHQSVRLVKQLKARAEHGLKRAGQILREGAMEEKAIAAPPLAVAKFCDDVADARAHSARIEARLRQLEQQQTES